MIEIQNLVYEYPNLRALNSVNYILKEGTITALVGPNGAGKTTLLRCMAALQTPYSGNIIIDGDNIVDNPFFAKSKVGFLQDFFGLYDDLTVRQSLSYFGKAHLVPADELESRIVKVANELNLYDKLDESAENLSRGMRQRLAIGQTIIFEPKYLLLDEPASGLDPEARISLSKLLIDLNSNGITILVSSHILAELDQYANELIILQNGNIIKSEKKADELSRLRISLSFLNEVANIEELLKTFDGIHINEINKSSAIVELEGGENKQSEFLKYLVVNDVVLKEFSVKKDNIQDQYLDILKSRNETND